MSSWPTFRPRSKASSARIFSAASPPSSPSCCCNACPIAAFFGEKDYQQLLVIKRLARDLDIPVEIVGCPTVREADGLAMSSRNFYLTGDERRIAAQLNAIMRESIAAIRAGAAIAGIEHAGKQRLTDAGFAIVDYFAVRDANTLTEVTDLSRPARLLAAAWLGKTRLIDNMAA